MRIFDCFMFYDEEVVLDIRLNSLKNSVDCFVIVESKFYHNGKKRDLKFDINKYPKLKDKIIYVVQDEEPSNLEQIKKNDILLYMKGSPSSPRCGFSSQAAQALMSCGERFAFIDILENPEIRSTLPQYANWPTFPQLWIQGQLVGGCDAINCMLAEQKQERS